MAVNLTKPFRGREYTPVHLMDEEESIQRSSLTTTAAPDNSVINISPYSQNIVSILNRKEIATLTQQ